VYRLLRSVAAASAVAGAAALLTTSAALASVSPLSEFEQARSRASTLQSGGDIRAKAALGAAADYLAVATAESLWVDENDAVPPPEGDAVFTNSTAALQELGRILTDHSVSSEAVLGVSGEIREAQTDLADIALEEVQGSTSAPGSAISKWKTAFSTLSKQISKATTSVPQSTVELAASDYLSSDEHELSAIPQPITGPALTLEGKPELFYFGAEGCPFCGVQRWSMAVALAQFGTFSPLAVQVSSTTDLDRATHTLSFYKAKYKSPYVAFVPVEAATNQPCRSETCEFPWTPLQAPTAGEQEILARYEVEGIPFLDVADSWATSGSYANPAVVSGMSWQQIAATLSEPASVAGQAIDGGAEILAAQICEVDGEQPARVCDSGVLRHYQEEAKSGFRSSFPPP